MKTGNQSNMKAKAKVIWCSTHCVWWHEAKVDLYRKG